MLLLRSALHPVADTPSLCSARSYSGHAGAVAGPDSGQGAVRALDRRRAAAVCRVCAKHEGAHSAAEGGAAGAAARGRAAGGRG